jgi:DNA-binding transcriptional LysR family regulator
VPPKEKFANFGGMDTEHLRTFLEVTRSRHFGKAAERLHVTQSAVSARIRLLEETLGATLLVRKRNNIELTPEGIRLRKHAETIVNAWARARQETGLEPDYSGALAIGAMWDLWEILLNEWLHAVRNGLPDTALQIEAGTAEVLIRKFQDGILDLAIVFEPPQVPDVEIREIATIDLVLASTRKGQSTADALADGYIMVDWGPTFSLAHARHFPDMPAPPIRMSLSTLALQHLRQQEGAAYLAERMLKSSPGEGHLHRVRDAPVIERSAYAMFRPDSDRVPLIRKALSLLKDL